MLKIILFLISIIIFNSCSYYNNNDNKLISTNDGFIVFNNSYSVTYSCIGCVENLLTINTFNEIKNNINISPLDKLLHIDIIVTNGKNITILYFYIDNNNNNSIQREVISL